MSANILPPDGFLSSDDRTTADMQAAVENGNSWGKELMGGASEGPTLSIVSNIITPPNDACIFPVDATGGGTVNLINISNIRDGGIVGLHCVSSSDPITISNLATGSGSNVPVATFSGQNIILTNPAAFGFFKYNATLNQFQEVFPAPDWPSPGAIGSITPNSGAFTSVTISTPLEVSSGGTGTSTAAGGSLFGVFAGSTSAPSFNAPGSSNQILGVANTGGGLEYKSILAGDNVTVTLAAGSITIAAVGFPNPMTAVGDIIVGSTGGSPARLGGNTSATKEFLTQTGTGSASAAPQWGSIVIEDLPSSVVTSSGNLSPLFSAAISSQNLTFSLNNSSAATIFGNFTGSSGPPSFNSPGTTDQFLSVAHSGGGIEWKSIVAGANITITPAAGQITIAAAAGFANPMTAVGDMIYGSTSGAATRLPGNTSTTKQFMVQTGTGSASSSPSWGSLATSDLPSSVVTSAGNLSPLFSSAILSQALSFSLSDASSGALFGNFSGASATPSFNAPGTNNQVLGVVNSGAGIEWKSIVAGANITITPAAGQITIAAAAGFTNPMTAVGDMIYGSTSGVATRLPGNTSTTKQFMVQTGTGSASSSPSWGSLATGDLPGSVVTSSGNLSPLFTTSISSQVLSYYLSNASAGGIFGNFSGTSAAPSFNAPGTANQVLGVAAAGGLEYKTIAAGTGISVTPSAGQLLIASTGANLALVNNCRLYTTSGEPYTDTVSPYGGGTTPNNGAQTLYFGPCNDQGNLISLYSSGSWSQITATETSVSLSSLTTSAIYDVYAYNNSGSVAIELVAWSGSTPSSKVSMNGVLVRSTDNTKLYVGTLETNINVISSVTYGCVYSSPGYRGIWNAFNRRPAPLGASDATADWTYSSSAWRIANGRTNILNSYGAAIIRVVVGAANCEPVSLTRFSKGPNSEYTVAGFIGLGLGNTTPVVATEMFATSYTAAGVLSTAAPYSTVPSSTGAMNYQCLEYAGGTCDFWGGIYGGMYGLAYC